MLRLEVQTITFLETRIDAFLSRYCPVQFLRENVSWVVTFYCQFLAWFTDHEKSTYLGFIQLPKQIYVWSKNWHKTRILTNPESCVRWRPTRWPEKKSTALDNETEIKRLSEVDSGKSPLPRRERPQTTHQRDELWKLANAKFF